MSATEHVHVSGQVAYWLMTGGVTLLLGIVVFWVKRWINIQDRQQEEWLRQGGLITRDKIEIFCNAQRAKCPAGASLDILCDWREGMTEKGGPLTKGEHTAICKEITKEVGNHFTDRIEEMFDHHREWVAQELKIIMAEQSAMRLMIQRQMRTEATRWDEHDERRGKPSSVEG